jgi:hypothetical protein
MSRLGDQGQKSRHGVWSGRPAYTAHSFVFNDVPIGPAPPIRRELNMTALQGWIVIGLLVLVVLGIVGLGAEMKTLPYLWRTSAEEIK